MEIEETVGTEEQVSIDRTDHNAASLSREITWIAHVVNRRLEQYFGGAETTKKKESWFNIPYGKKDGKEASRLAIERPKEIVEAPEIAAPDLEGDDSIYAEFVRHYQLNTDERIVLMLALIPHVQPHLLDVFFSQNRVLGRGYTEFGGIKGIRHSGFIPTLETVLFILAGNDLGKRFLKYYLFETDHVFSSHDILYFDRGQASEPFFCSALHLTDEYVDFFTTGILRKPQFSLDFPAKRLLTKMDWEDLVVDEFTGKQLDEIRIWLEYGKTLYEDWGMGKKLTPGYKALFYGPPGTGKTLTASLLGKLYNLDVYKVDLSMVISKYIGETEKNLEKVFKKAENKNWILFFDEADALFGKRTNISDSHDKYANQEIAYLLQRLEDYPGLVILASNMRSNVDQAFTRRLQSIIHLPKPQPRERYRIWINAFSDSSQPPSEEEILRIANQYELSGGSIMNVVQYTSLMALNRNDTVITVNDILDGIKKEFKKEGKTI